MPLTLMQITNDPRIAELCDRHGIDWVFVDLERLGKAQRQGHLDTVKSEHTVSDVVAVKKSLTKAKLVVRVDPLNPQSSEQIDAVISGGADVVMLPYFTDAQHAEKFISLVNGRSQTCLLVETAGAAEDLEEILSLPGVDYVHIGLNDLHLDLKKKFMFELLCDGTVEKIATQARQASVPFGFGGFARVGTGAVPAELIIPEHVRLGSQMAILSRGFLDLQKPQGYDLIETKLETELAKIRDLEEEVGEWTENQFQENLLKIRHAVEQVVNGEGATVTKIGL